jgi:hypothetical protein
MARLPGLLGRMDASALAQLLTKAGFVANTAGQAGVPPTAIPATTQTGQA